MDILFTILSLFIFGAVVKFSTFFRNIPNVSNNILIVFFIVKCIAGFLYLFIYKNYYEPETADVYKYFNDGMIMADAFKGNPMDFFRMLSGIDSQALHLDKYYSQMASWYRPWEEPMYNDNRIIIRFNAIIGLFSGGNIGIHNIVANFLSFIGLVSIIKFVGNKTTGEKTLLILFGVFLFPSVLFWGSGILKESVLIFALGFLLLNTDKLVNKQKLWWLSFIKVAVSLFLLFFLKAYIVLLLAPLLLTYYFIRNKKNKFCIYLYPSVFVFWSAIFLLVGLFYPTYDPLSIIANKQNNFVFFSEHVEAGSLFTRRLLEPNLFSLLCFIPTGFWNTLTRPHLLDVNSIVVLTAAIENLIIWLMIIVLFIFGKKNNLFNPFVWFCFSFVILTFILVGIVTPVYGGLVRYKIPALPFFWIGFVMLLDSSRFFNKFKEK